MLRSQELMNKELSEELLCARLLGEERARETDKDLLPPLFRWIVLGLFFGIEEKDEEKLWGTSGENLVCEKIFMFDHSLLLNREGLQWIVGWIYKFQY